MSLKKNNKNSRTNIIKLNKIDRDLLWQNRKEQILLTIQRFFRNKLAVTGGSIVFILIILALFAAVLTPYDPFVMDSSISLAGVSKEHLLGADNYGRDTLTRIIYGARISLIVGLISTSISTFFGIIIGGIAGFYGKKVDLIVMRFMDALMSFPSILLAIVLVAILGPTMINAMVAIGIVYIPVVARVVRSAVLVNKENEYIDAARVSGRSNLSILFTELIPNCLSPIIVQTTVVFADAIIIEAGLSFIGLGQPPPNASWGKMLNEAMQFMNVAPHVAIFPGLAISFAVLGFNMLGDGLRDVLDPRLKRSKA